jgi:hypothetical protein
MSSRHEGTHFQITTPRQELHSREDAFGVEVAVWTGIVVRRVIEKKGRAHEIQRGGELLPTSIGPDLVRELARQLEAGWQARVLGSAGPEQKYDIVVEPHPAIVLPREDGTLQRHCGPLGPRKGASRPEEPAMDRGFYAGMADWKFAATYLNPCGTALVGHRQHPRVAQISSRG